MVAVKTHQANAFLTALDRVPPAVLLYGGDAGLVAERAAQLAKRLAERDDPPGEIIRLDDASLEEDPGRIFVELQTAPMFGGRKVLRTVAGRRVTAAQLKPLVEGGDLQGMPDRRGRQPAPRRCAARAVREIARGRGRCLLSRRGARSRGRHARGVRAGQDADHAGRQAPAAGAARRRPRAVAGGDRQARALCARQEHDRGERRGGGRRRRGRARSRPHRDGRRVRRGRRRRWPNATAASPRARARSPSSPRCSATSCGCIACAARSTPAASMEDVVRSLRPPPHFKQREAIEQQCRAGPCPSSPPRSPASPTPPRPRASTPRWRARWRRICCWTLARSLASKSVALHSQRERRGIAVVRQAHQSVGGLARAPSCR